AIVERGDAVPELEGLPADGPPSVAGTVVSYRANSIAFDVDAPAAGLVVLNEAFYEGWKVTVDGKAATPVRANVLLRGVVVGPGHHRVVWKFAPRGYWWLFFLWLAAIGVLIAGARSARAESRRR